MKDLRPIYYHEAKDRLIGNRLNVYDALRTHGPITGTDCDGQEENKRLRAAIDHARSQLTQ